LAQFPLDPCNIGTADHHRVKRLAKKYAVSFPQLVSARLVAVADEFAGSGIDADQTAGDVTLRNKSSGFLIQTARLILPPVRIWCADW
jgi:hypothetical protein